MLQKVREVLMQRGQIERQVLFERRGRKCDHAGQLLAQRRWVHYPYKEAKNQSQINKRPECAGMSLISNTTACTPRSASVQKSVRRERRFSCTETFCGALVLFSTETISR